ncbi:universal stress protein [Natronolimnobius sp. AArcel1]|uniref:universal stress protein n=1 Tax=Natronolimnobius sp. AArcel1 TaxID=1679093 RepID=UPI0013E9C583|nr:universal stress protein [Natronolimnobius sp. AArcel1]NGM69148.1 universal stress protein [Natronolimnobius sp. AArcel1]
MGPWSNTSPETIVVPIANTETATRQLETAVDLAADRSARIVLVYVCAVPPQLSLQDGRRYLVTAEDEQLLEDAAASVTSHGLAVDTRIRLARGVSRGIVGAVDAYDADTIVLGWRGRPPRQNVMLGSHVDRVLRDAECDVLVKRIQTPTETVDGVLVPVAEGPHAEFAAETAAAIARQNDASITLLHVRDTADPERSETDARALLAETAADIEDVHSVDRKLVAAGDVAGTITDWTATHDVTVLGVSRGGLVQRKLLGSISRAVGRHAAGTVILAKRYDSVPSRLKRLFS